MYDSGRGSHSWKWALEEVKEWNCQSVSGGRGMERKS